MKITSVDPIYLKMPSITTAADGTQDTLLVRIRTDEGIDGWGECDASPLVSLTESLYQGVKRNSWLFSDQV